MKKEQEKRINLMMDHRFQTEEEREKLGSYLDTNYGKRLKSELYSLVHEKRLRPLVMEYVLIIDAVCKGVLPLPHESKCLGFG